MFNKKRFIKSGMTLLTALAVSVMPMLNTHFAAAEDEDASVLYLNDGTNTDGIYGEGVRNLFVMKDGADNHKDYLKFGRSTSILQIVKDIPPRDGKVLELGRAEISFDICARQTNHFFIMMLGDTNGVSQEMFFMNGMGKMGYQMSGGWPTATYSPSCQRAYEKNRWYNVKILFDMNNRTITYYLDGKLWGETAITKTSAFIDAEPKNIYFNIMTNYTMKSGAVAQSDGSEEFWLDNIEYSFPQVTESGVTVSTGQDGNIYFSKDVSADFTVTNPLSDESKYTLEVSATSSDNFRAADKSQEVIVPPKGTTTQKIEFTVPEYGFYTLNATLKNSDGTVAAQTDTRFSVLNGRADGKRNEKMGMSNHFGHQYGDPKVIIPLDTKMGFKLARDDVAWPHIVSNSGEQLADTVFYRNFLNWSKMVMDADMDILAIIGGAGHPGLLGYSWPASADKLKEKNSLGEWYKHVYTLVSSQPEIEAWELYNEWNINSNDANGGTPEAYAEVLRTGATAVRAANPNAKIVAFCTALVDTEWIERVLVALGNNPGQYFDAISVHPYVTSGEMPEKGGVEDSITALHTLMDKYGLSNKEVWSTEFGYSTGAQVKKVTEKSQAEYTVRGSLILDPYVDKNVMYTITQKQAQSAGETGFGMVRTYSGLKINYEARPLAAAMTNYNNIMCDAEFVDKQSTDDGIYIYRYKKADGKQVAVMWSIDSDKTVSVNLGTDKVEQIDIYGNAQDVYAYGGEHTFYLSGSPLYVIGDIAEVRLSDSAKIKAENLNVTTAQNDDFKISVINNIPNTEIKAKTSDNISAESAENDGIIKFTTGNKHKEVENYAFDTVSTVETVRLSCVDDSGKVYFYAPLNVDYKDAAETELNLVPYKNGRWQAVLNLTNSKSERPISGEVSVVEPEDMTTLFKPKRFENIKSGESEKIVFNIPEQLTGISGEFAFEIKTDDGEVKRVSDDTSFIAIEKMKKLPDIDGKISDGEWSAKSPIVLNSLTQVQQISNWGGTDDLSGVIYTGYNDKYFCLAAKVKDDVHYDHDDQNRLYTVDSIQLAFAPQKTKDSKRTELGLALMDGKPTLVRYSYAGGVSLMGIPDSALEYDLNKFVDTEYAMTNNGSETIYELKIPWGELFGPDFRINSVNSVNFCVLINDNDGGGRRGWIELSGGIGTVKDASQFVKIPLVK